MSSQRSSANQSDKWLEVNVTTGLTQKNMPVGMQIVGPSFETETVMQFAYAYSMGAKVLHRRSVPSYKEVK